MQLIPQSQANLADQFPQWNPSPDNFYSVIISNKVMMELTIRLPTQKVDVNPNTDFVIPMALYQNQINTDPLSVLLFPVRSETEWIFPAERDGLFLVKIFYVFSPSITPLPPLGQTYLHHRKELPTFCDDIDFYIV